MDVVAFEFFTKKRARDFKSIANQTEGELEVEDLHSEAWFAAEYHAAKRGFEIDWADPADQKLIFGTLTVKYVWRTKKERALKVSGDEEREDTDGSTLTLFSLVADETAADPLELLERREEEEQHLAAQEREDAFLGSFSQSVAYNVALWNFDNIRRRLASHLAIDRGTLSDRIARAALVLKMQASLFDGIERIDDAFKPEQGQACAVKVKQHCTAEQWCWEFEEDIPPAQSALSRIQHDELCEVVSNGKTREARWHRTTRLFFFTDGNRPVFCTVSDAQEWWPAGVKF